jgi:mannosyl-3-phosphoglycerate phosphatase
VKPVIFTDLDGSLLDPVDYSYEAALPALGVVKERRIPLVLTSSKTRAEIEAYRERLGNRDPFIPENGAALFLPDGCFPFVPGGVPVDGYSRITFGTPYEVVRMALAEIRRETGAAIKGFGDMTEEEVAEVTGLTKAEAKLGKAREFDEPFVIDGSDGVKRDVLGRIEEKGLNWTRGRFYHVLGAHDKATAVRVLKGFYARLYGDIVTIGIGDSLNDVPLLKEVDRPVLVQKAGGGYEPVDIDGLFLADGTGPVGWNSSVIGILEELGG